MEPDEAAFADVQFLTGSPQRFAVLAALCESPARPCELDAEVDATRTTIQRILAGFQDREWIYKREGHYRPTATGRRVFDQYQSLLGEAERGRDLGPIAVHLDAIADTLPEELLTESAVTRSSEQDPLAAVTRLIERFESVDGRVRAISPIVTQSFNEVAADLLESAMEMEFVIDEGVLERSATDFPTALERGVEHGNIDVFVCEDALSFGLILDEAGCCLAVYDDENNLRATVESTDDAVCDWAAVQFEQRRERSRPLGVLLADRDG